MVFGFFLGCIIPNRYPGIETAIRYIFDDLDIQLLDLKGASCCPAPGVFRSFVQDTWLVIAARNLCIAEELGVDIVTACNGCFGSLSDANFILKNSPKNQAKVNKNLSKIGHEFKGTTNVYHFVSVLKDFGIEKIEKFVEYKFRVKIAPHYGCHLLRPSIIRQVDSPEKPTILEKLINVVGSECVEYKDKMKCCGAGGGVRAACLDLALDMCEEKLENITLANPDCIINVCPFCHLQFDVGQKEINEKFEKDFNIPILHYAQFLALAMGHPPKSLGLDAHTISVKPFLQKIKRLL
jgi:heterodisulfide reductase subunit B